MVICWEKEEEMEFEHTKGNKERELHKEARKEKERSEGTKRSLERRQHNGSISSAKQKKRIQRGII